MKAILRFKKMATLGNVAGMEKHVERRMNVPNADINKLKENISFINGSSLVNLHNRLAEIKEEGGIIQKNSVVAIDCLMTASPEFWADGNKNKEKGFIDKSHEYLQETFGRENIMSMVLHKDETTPHIHAIICPAYESKDKWGNKKIRVGAKKWLDGRQKLSEQQDRFAEIMEPLGLERGKKGSKATHNTIQKFYSDLEKKEGLFNSILKDFPKKNTLTSHEKYMEAVEAHLLGFSDVKKLIKNKELDKIKLIKEVLKGVNDFNKTKKVDYEFIFNQDKVNAIQPSKVKAEIENKKGKQKEIELRQKEEFKDIIFNELMSTKEAREINWNNIKMFFEKLEKDDKEFVIRNIEKDTDYIGIDKKRAFFVITGTSNQRDILLGKGTEIKSRLRENNNTKENEQGFSR